MGQSNQTLTQITKIKMNKAVFGIVALMGATCTNAVQLTYEPLNTNVGPEAAHLGEAFSRVNHESLTEKTEKELRESFQDGVREYAEENPGRWEELMALAPPGMNEEEVGKKISETLLETYTKMISSRNNMETSD